MWILRKVPAIIYLERSNMQSTVDLNQVPTRLDPSILYQDTSIALFVSPSDYSLPFFKMY